MIKGKGSFGFFFNMSIFAVIRVVEKSLKMSVVLSERVRDQAEHEKVQMCIFSMSHSKRIRLNC